MVKEEIKNELRSIVNSAMSEKRKLTQVEQERMEELKQELRALQEKETEEEDPKEEEEPMDEPNDDKEDEPSQEEEEPMEDEPKEEEDKIEKNACTQDNKEKKSTCAQEDKENKRTLNIKSKKMNKEFRLLKAIADIANNRQIDDVALAVSEAGKEEMRANGLSYGGQIQIPVESRAAISVTAEGEDVVATNIYNVMEPLRAKNVLVQAGAKFITNLTGDVQIPLMTATNCGWESEMGEAKDGAGTFSSIKLSPRRITCFIDLSKQFLIQQSAGCEELIRQDIINAINSKLEATILGEDEGDLTKPAGIFSVIKPSAHTVSNFADLCNAESDIEDANVVGELKYVMSNKAKAALRSMQKSAKTTQLVMENGQIDGTQVLNTSHVSGKKFAYGDWSNLAIGQFGAIDLTVDSYSQATKGVVRLVINAFFDAKVLRPEAFVTGTIA